MSEAKHEILIGACDCCAYEPTQVSEFPGELDLRTGKRAEKPRRLCDLCASTMASNAHQYPDQYRGQVEILRTVTHVGNAILAAIDPASVRLLGRRWICTDCDHVNESKAIECVECETGRRPA